MQKSILLLALFSSVTFGADGEKKCKAEQMQKELHINVAPARATRLLDGSPVTGYSASGIAESESSLKNCCSSPKNCFITTICLPISALDCCLAGCASIVGTAPRLNTTDQMER